MAKPPAAARQPRSASFWYHLGKVFAKLAISSRSQLDRVLAESLARTRPK